MKPDQDTTKPVFDTSDIGCYFDSSRGIYIGVAVQELAMDYNWQPDTNGIDEFPMQPNDEWYNDTITEAIEHLQSLTLEGLWWGYSESGDFGLWLVDCDRCDGLGELYVDTIAGRFRDYCPSCKGTGNELQIKI